jgi:hypothetical protein
MARTYNDAWDLASGGMCTSQHGGQSTDAAWALTAAACHHHPEMITGYRKTGSGGIE